MTDTAEIAVDAKLAPRRRHLHRSTWCVVVCVALLFLLINIPGEHSSIDFALVGNGWYGGDSLQRVEHGWPLTWLGRDGNNYPWDNCWPWRLTSDVLGFHPVFLALNFLTGVFCVAAVGWGYERWRRRRPRLLMITLREMLLVTLLAACGCAWGIRIYEHGRQLNAAFEALETSADEMLEPMLPQWFTDLTGIDLPVEYGFRCTRGQISWPDKPDRVAVLDALTRLLPDFWIDYEHGDLAALRGNRSIGALRLGIERSTMGSSFDTLGTLIGLRKLIVSEQFISDSPWDGRFPLRSLRGLDRLEFLVLPDSLPLDDNDLAELARHQGLKVLGLRSLHVTDAGLAHLASLRQLRCLSLTGSAIDDHTLEFVGRLSRLEVLSLDGPRITDKGLSALAPLANLQILTIRGAQLTEAGLPALAQFEQLTNLDLSQNDIRSLKALGPAQLRHLRMLDLGQTPIPDLDVFYFGLAHPQCVVNCEPQLPVKMDLVQRLNSGNEYLFLDGPKPCGDQIRLINEAKNIRALYVGRLVRETDFEIIASLTDLESLVLRNDLNQPMVKLLARLPKLWQLELITCRLTDDAAEALADLPLKELELNNVEISPKGWQSMGRLKSLKTLDLFKTPITDADLGQLSGLSRLSSLEAYRSSLTDAGIAALAPLTELRKLRVTQSGLTDAGLKLLTETNPELVELDISRTQITHAGLAYLRSLKHLDTLSVDRQLLDSDGIAPLKRCGALCNLRFSLPFSSEPIDQPAVNALMQRLQVEIPQLESVDYD